MCIRDRFTGAGRGRKGRPLVGFAQPATVVGVHEFEEVLGGRSAATRTREPRVRRVERPRDLGEHDVGDPRPVTDEVVRRLEKPGAVFEDVRELVAGAKGKEVLETGDLSKGVFWAGMVQGLIHDIPTCAELVSRIMRDAEAIIQGRFAGMLSGGHRQAAE